MLSSILAAAVGLVVFSVWLYGAKILYQYRVPYDDEGSVIFLHIMMVGFPISFTVGIYSLCR